MGGNKHWLLYLAGIALLSVVALSTEIEGHTDCQLEKRPKIEKNPATDRHWQILCELSRKFVNYRQTTQGQYGVLYLPPPGNEPASVPTYEPTQPQNDPPEQWVDPWIYPVVPSQSTFQYNYAVTIPFPDEKKIKRHTEDKLLTDVYPRMLQRYRQNPNAVYLYSSLNPCKACTQIISDILQSANLQGPLYVGYSGKLKNAGDIISCLDIILKEKLLKVSPPASSQEGCVNRRIKRQANSTNEYSTEEFCSGEAQMQWARGEMITTMICSVLALISARSVLW